jgi:hypothetical protein
MQYAQQGIRSIIYDLLESYELTAGHINFRDQSVNQNQAISGSIDGQLATIDLSDASDRVPRDLALEMFRAYPEFQGAIDACRSTKAELPDGRIIGPLRKFASMGSALCFPVESMYFYTICVAALLRNRKLSVSRRNVYSVTRDIYVYGDDLIVPVNDAGTVLEYLQKYNCKVNTRKSFWSGNFRESCGVDAYRGKQVTPVYIRRQRPENRRQASELISWSRTANLFFKKGYYRTAEFMHTMCERVIGLYPDVPDTSSALGRTYPVGSDSHIRMNRCTQSLEIKAWVPTPVYRIDKLEGYAALMKSFLKLGIRKDPIVVRNVLLEGASWQQDIPVVDDPLHLERSALYGAVTLKLRWVRAS